ncbi:hypothetical protein V3C99_000665 [Haemonchus contortus]
MSDNVKKPKSSVLLYLLLAVTVLVLLCAATIVFLALGSRTPEPIPLGNATSSSLFFVPNSTQTISTVGTIQTSTRPPETTRIPRLRPTNPVYSTTRATTTLTAAATSPTDGPTTTEAITVAVQPGTSAEPTLTTEFAVTTEPSTSTTTTEATTTTTTTTTTAQALVPTPFIDENAKVIDKCMLVIAERVTCPKTRDDVVALSPSALSPLHYALNLSVQTVQPTVIEGDVQILLRTNEQGKQITLDVDSKLRNVEDIRVMNCDTGATLCVAKTVFDQREQRLSLILSENIQAGSHLRVDVLKFAAVDTRDFTYSQIAPRWNRNAPIMVGTLLNAGSAKRLFPGLENPVLRATLDLCVRFTTAGHVRSNAATKFVSGDVTCFERTVPLATQQMAFAGFEKAETLIHNRTTLDGVEIPAVEVVFSLNKNFKREKHQWIYSEASKVISLMSQWTGFPYPLEALRIISAPIQASSHSSLGLITLQDRLVEHPTYTLAHVTLIHSVIQQWLSNVVSVAKTDEACFSESLTVYLEWKLNEELHIVNKTRANEIESIRPQDLSTEGKDETRMLRSLEMIHSCPERLISIFHTIEGTFGQDTVKNILKYMFRNFAYSAATITDWQQAAVEVTGNENAGEMLKEWFSRKTRPVLQMTVTTQAIQFEQLTDELWTVPLEIVGSSGIQLVAVTDKSTILPFTSNDYVIADPRRKSTAMVVYDADSYIRMIRCWDDTRCPANRDAVRGILRDLVAVLLTDRLPPPQLVDIPKWKAVFKFSQNNRILNGNAACCAQYAISRNAEIACTWVVRDTCEKIRLFNTIATSGV